MFAFALSVGLDFVDLLLQGWMASVVWGWFVVPSFHLGALPFAAAAGLIALTHLMWPVNQPSLDEEARTAELTWKEILREGLLKKLYGHVRMISIVGLAWIVKALWM